MISVTAIQVTDTAINVHGIAIQTTAICPDCAQSSCAIHSRYTRRLADLPWAGIPVTWRLKVHKFFCRNLACPRRIFTERLPQMVASYHRQTQRLREQQYHLALALGGEAGARTAARLGVSASAKTLLRRVMAMPLTALPTPHSLGVDDWALRKGQTYGTILVDLERHRPVDLLPDRSAATLEQWLKAHPGVAIIARDRAGDYAEGATRGAPEAVQVADRFHLVQNAHQVLCRLLERHSSRLGEAACAVNELSAMPAPATATIESPAPDSDGVALSAQPPTKE